MHFFSYLGCILALYQGNPVTEWGYRFAVTTEGFPFSGDFECARRLLERRGIVTSDAEGWLEDVSEEAFAEFTNLSGIPSFARRSGWVKSALECTLALPIGSIRSAVGSLPAIRTASILAQNQALFDEDEIELLYSEFRLLEEAFADGVADPLSPAVIWLSARLLGQEEAVSDSA